jgi:hypothetical protein
MTVGPSIRCTFQPRSCRSMATKRKRVQELAGISGVSDAALALILNNLRENPIPDPTSRHQINRAVLAAVTDIADFVDVPRQAADPYKWMFLRPELLLREAMLVSPALQASFREAFLRHPCSSERTPVVNRAILR